MKNRKSLLSIAALMMAVILLIGSVPVTAAAGAERKYTEKEIDAYLYNMKNTSKLKCLIYDDMPSMPYISVTDYLYCITEVKFPISESSNGVYTVTSPTEKTMVIDTVKDTVHFDAFENFFPSQAADADNDGPEGYYIKDLKLNVEGTQNAVELDLSKYRIDITAVNGAVYFPLATLSDLFADTFLTAAYVGGKIYFMQESTAYFDDSELYQTTPRSADMIDFTYRDLCFVLDNLFGYPPKSELGQQIIENDGFDGFMSNTEFGNTVKPLLMSESIIDYYTGLVLIDSMLDDGGHSSLSDKYTKELLADKPSPFAKAVNAMLESSDGPNAAAIALNVKDSVEQGESSEQLGKIRTEALSKYELVKKWVDEKDVEETPVAQLFMADDTAIFLFDEFKDEAVPAFKWSLDYAKEKGAKNFLIDLSLNTGGSSAVLMYIQSIITGKSDIYVKNMLNGNFIHQTSVIDRNLDKVIDEKDNELKYDFRFAIITSHHAFSCANYLPCLLQESQIPIVGEASGGGTCFILQMNSPTSLPYTISGYKMMVDEKGNTVESGVKPDYKSVTVDAEGNADYSKLYDVGAIRSFLDEYYSKVTPTMAAPVAAAASSASAASVGNILMIVIPVVLAVVVIAVVIMIVVKRRKKPVETVVTDDTDSE